MPLMTTGLSTDDPNAGEDDPKGAGFTPAAQDALADVSHALDGLREIAERVSSEGLGKELADAAKGVAAPDDEDEGPAEIETDIPPELLVQQKAPEPIQQTTPEPAVVIPSAPVKKMRVGERLKAARLESGFSLEEVAAEVKIKPHHLAALEESRYGDLPSRTYAVGFVRAYAHALSLPVDEMAEACRAEAGTHLPKHMPIAAPLAAVESPLPSASLVVLCAAAAFILYALGYVFLRPSVTDGMATPALPTPTAQVTQQTPSPVAPPPSPPPQNLAPVQQAQPSAATPPMAPAVTQPTAIEMQQPALSDSNPPLEQPEIDTTNVAPGLLNKGLVQPLTPQMQDDEGTMAAAPPAPSRIKLRAVGDATVQIFDAFGKLIAERTIAKGEAFFVPDKAGYTLATSNAGALHVQIDGREMATLGENEEAMHNIPLNAEILQKYLQ